MLIVYVYSTFIHSNLRGSFGVLERILVVPRFHHWRHGIEEEARYRVRYFFSSMQCTPLFPFTTWVMRRSAARLASM